MGSRQHEERLEDDFLLVTCQRVPVHYLEAALIKMNQWLKRALPRYLLQLLWKGRHDGNFCEEQ